MEMYLPNPPIVCIFFLSLIRFVYIHYSNKVSKVSLKSNPKGSITHERSYIIKKIIFGEISANTPCNHTVEVGYIFKDCFQNVKSTFNYKKLSNS